MAVSLSFYILWSLPVLPPLPLTSLRLMLFFFRLKMVKKMEKTPPENNSCNNEAFDLRRSI